MNIRATISGAMFLGLFAVTIAAWTHGGTLSALERLVPKQPYYVTLIEGQATVDLYLEPDTAVRLLTSNLGSPNRNATLRARTAPLSGRVQHPPAAWKNRPLVVDRPSEIEPAQQNELGGTKPVSPPAATRDFWLHVTETPLENPRGYQLIHGQLASSQQTVEVYADASLNSATGIPPHVKQLADDIAVRLSREVLPTIHKHVGPVADPDQNGRLTVLLTPWLGRLRGGTTQVRGFVRSSDLRTDIAAPFSNHADLVYLNSDLPTGDALQTMLLHEVAHTALGSRQSSANGALLSDWDDWLNEGLAHLAEQQGHDDWSNVDYRLARYWQNPAAASLAVRDYYRTGRWRNHGCRGATFLFLDWCRQEALRRGVTHFISALMATGKSDAEAIELVCGKPFEDLYREWTLALAAEPLATRKPMVGRFLNSGPRFEQWNVGSESQHEFDVSGSATQFTELRASTAGWYRLQFDGDPLDAWQITLVKNPQTSPEISLRATWIRGDTADPPRLMISTKAPLHAGWEFDEVTCELIREPHPRAWTWRAASLTVSENQTFAIPLSMEEVTGTEAVVKVRFKNATGQIAWGWVDVSAASPKSIIQVSRRP